ncbi:MAG: DsbA family protein [Acetobacteraceae bacterium]|nr:DsbA family protein [Acetobacteraceae bacterium]
MIVDYYFGAGSRYSYLAATQLAALGRETGARFNWLAVDSARLIAARRDNPFAAANGVGQYDWGYRRRDAEAWAELYGVPFREPHGRLALDSDLLSLACTAARRLGAAETYARALFRAIFVDDLTAVDRAVCVARAGAVGLDQTAFSAALDDPQTQAARERVLHQAMRLGVFGVPSFVVGERLFWGNDRLVLLRHALLSPPHRPGAAATTL